MVMKYYSNLFSPLEKIPFDEIEKYAEDV